MTEKNSKEEIDVLSLFSLIGKKTNSLLFLIINTFISILNLILSLLNIAKKNYLALLICTMIGTLTGYFYEKKIYVPQYKTTLTLAPNFGSTYQVYENIKFYNSLILQKDFKTLRKYLDIDSLDAISLLEISIKPHTNESLKLQHYQQLLNEADSITALTLSYEKFVNKIPFDSYLSHVIELKSTDNKVPSQLEPSIITAIEKNKYYRDKKNTYLKNLKIKKEFIKTSIRKIDTLLFSENKNDKGIFEGESLGTTILLDKNLNKNIEIQLFDRYNMFRNELISVNLELNDKSNIINIISSFSKTAELSENNHDYLLKTSLISFLITLIIILSIKINSFLKQNPNFSINKLGYKN